MPKLTRLILRLRPAYSAPRTPHALRGPMGDAAARLPNLSKRPSESVRATGTDGRTAENTTKKSAPEGAPKSIHSQAIRCDTVRDDKPKMPLCDTEENAMKIGVKSRTDVQEKELRVLGLEPRTYGLKGRCSTN